MVDMNENVKNEQESEKVTVSTRMEKKNATPEEYGASNIQLLEGLEAVRKRPVDPIYIPGRFLTASKPSSN